MRRAVFLITLAAICAQPATCSAQNTVKLHVAFDPDRPDTRTTVELAIKISGPTGSVPSPITSLDLRLPENMGIAASTLGQANCASQELIADGLEGCSANARIGYGSALAIVPHTPENIVEPFSINALMGSPTGEHFEILFYAEGLSPVVTELVLPGMLLPDTPPYGERLDTTVPLLSAWSEGPYVALESLDTTIGPLHLTYHRQLNGKLIAYHPHGIRIPPHCPPGGYPFAATITFQDTTHTTSHYNVPCPRR